MGFAGAVALFLTVAISLVLGLKQRPPLCPQLSNASSSGHLCQDCGLSTAAILAEDGKLLALQEYALQDQAGTGWMQKYLASEISTDRDHAGDACWLVSKNYINLYSRILKIPVLIIYQVDHMGQAKTITLDKRDCRRRDPRLSPHNSLQCDTASASSLLHLLPNNYTGAALLSSAVPTSSHTTATNMQDSLTEIEHTAQRLAEQVSVSVFTGPMRSQREPMTSVKLDGFFKVIVWCKKTPDQSCDIQMKYDIISKESNETGSTKSGVSVKDIVNIVKERTGIALLFGQVGSQRAARSVLSTGQTKGGKGSCCASCGIPLIHSVNKEMNRATKKMTGSAVAEQNPSALNTDHRKPPRAYRLCQVMKKIITKFAESGLLKLVMGQKCVKQADKTDQNPGGKRSVQDQGGKIPDKQVNKEDISSGKDRTSRSDPKHERTFKTRSLQKSIVYEAIVPKGKTLKIFTLLGLPEKKVPVINFSIQKIKYDCSSMVFEIETRPTAAKLTLIPGLLELRDVSVGVFISLKQKSTGLSLLKFDSMWRFGDLNMRVSILYNVSRSDLVIKTLPQVSPTIDISGMIRRVTGVTLPLPLPSFTVKDISIIAGIDTFKGGSATIAVSGTVGKTRIHAIFRKSINGRGKFMVAFAADFPSFKLAKLMRKVADVDISHLPFFGSLVIPHTGMTISTGYIYHHILSSVFSKKSMLIKTRNEIGKGFTVITSLHLGGKKVPIKISYSSKVLTIVVQKGSKLELQTLFSAIPGVNIGSMPIPSGVRSLLRISIQYFQLNAATGELSLYAGIPGELRYFNGKLIIRNPAVEVHARLKSPRKLTADFFGLIKIGGKDRSVVIYRSLRKDSYVVSVTFKNLAISKLAQHFAASVVPSAFKRLKSLPFLNFIIHNAKISFPIGAKPLQLHMSGTPVIAGFKAVHLNLVLVKSGGKVRMVSGFDLSDSSVASLLKRITGKTINVPLLKQKLHMGVVVSPVSLPSVRLRGKLLQHMSVKKGVSIQAPMHWPASCGSDRFCAVARKLVRKDARLALQGTIRSTSSYSLMAKVSNIKLGGGMTLAQVGLVMNVNKQGAEFGIEGKLHLKKQGVTLYAGIRLSPRRGVVMEGYMKGCWNRAFGIRWLAICNLRALVALTPTTVISALELGGQVVIGRCNPKIKATGFIGLDQLNPHNNYYYARVEGGLTLKVLLESILCKPINLPRPVANSGFPKGFLSSFSLLGKTLPHVPLNIPRGIHISGTLNILGLSASIDMTIAAPKGFKLNIELPVLNFANGLIKMSASRGEPRKGPMLKAVIMPPRIEFAARGYLSVLGIKREAALTITKTSMELFIRGKLLLLFDAQLRIKASYGSIKSAKFTVEGLFENDMFQKLNGMVKDAAKKSADQADRHISKAQQKLSSARNKLSRVEQKLRRCQRRVNKAKRHFDHAVNKVRELKHRLSRLCRIRRCRNKHVCIPCVKGTRCCRRAWGMCVCRKPHFGKCCKSVPNLICIGANKVCRGHRFAVHGLLRGAEVVVDKSRHSLNVVRHLLRGPQFLVNAARRGLGAANAFLEHVKKAYRIGVRAASMIVRYTLGGIINILEVAFRAEISHVNTGIFSVRVKVQFFRRSPQVFQLRINLRNPLQMVKQLAEHAVHGLKKFIS